ncbi:hypothetical protein G6011_09005 [Alternaria panax]|uniref:Uncharacterized protein n=1 Tax=Alternaria panax TaxID=48097 RepID=A0AAD4IAA4_9PLEO|nr:hypothetical protein G6011_09005 [Alternaria panax]
MSSLTTDSTALRILLGQPATSAPPTADIIYQRLPYELIMHIIYLNLHLRTEPQSPRPIDYYRFQCHSSRNGRLGRHLVLSKSLYTLVIEAFYRGNQFKCDHRQRHHRHRSDALPIDWPIILPPPHARHHVRRLEVIMSLEGSVSALASSFHGRTLMSLTSSTTGFSELEFLRLVIKPYNSPFHKGRAEWPKGAGIMIRAKEDVIIEGWTEAERFIKVEAKVVKWVP